MIGRGAAEAMTRASLDHQSLGRALGALAELYASARTLGAEI